MEAPTRDQIRAAGRRLNLTFDDATLGSLESRLAAAATATARLAELVSNEDAPATEFSPRTDR